MIKFNRKDQDPIRLEEASRDAKAGNVVRTSGTVGPNLFSKDEELLSNLDQPQPKID